MRKQILCTIEIHLEEWSTGYPNGVVLYGTSEGELIDSDFAENAAEIIAVLENHREDIKNNRPSVNIICNIDDIDSSRVMECVNDIKAYLDRVRYDETKDKTADSAKDEKATAEKQPSDANAELDVADAKVKCGIDPTVTEGNCKWCCIYCEDEYCEYRCEIVQKVESGELNGIEDECIYV